MTKELESLLKKELRRVARMALMQRRVRDAVRERKWLEFDVLNNELDRCGASLKALEQKRSAICGAVGGSRSFYTMTRSFPLDERRRVNTLYRGLKKQMLGLRMANSALQFYIRESRALAQDFIGAAYPQARGSLYTRRGLSLEPEMGGVLIGELA
jgi:hypothetical protein